MPRNKPAPLPLLPLLALLLGPGTCLADNCEAIQAQIEAKMRAGGLANVRLATFDAGTTVSGRVVGSCGNGSKRIVQIAAGPGGSAPAAGAAPTAPTALAARPTAAPARPPARDNIPTECRDGSVVIGPDCSNPAALRLPAPASAAVSSRVPAPVPTPMPAPAPAAAPTPQPPPAPASALEPTAPASAP